MTEALPPDHPLPVQWEFASEERVVPRNVIYRWLVDGVDPDDVAFAAVAEAAPAEVLEVGSGPGEFAERLQRELGAHVRAVDVSPRMVELTAQRGVDVTLGDVQELPFPDDEFDCAVANWVLYHVPHVDREIDELARVLRPGGRLVEIREFVSATITRAHLADRVPPLAGPFDARSAHVVFVADKEAT